MRIIAADSGSALLNSDFKAQLTLSTAAVVIDPPYTHPFAIREQQALKRIDDRSVILDELKLCLELARQYRPDAVHVDVTLNSLDLASISAEELLKTIPSKLARRFMEPLAPYMVEVAREIRRTCGAPVLLVGKESVPVRVAELTAGAHGVLRGARKALNEGVKVLIGLPRACTSKVADGRLTLVSLLPAEEDVEGYAADEEGVLMRVQLREYVNPVASGFKMIEVNPKEVEGATG
ncbi:MAG: DUF4152 family protein [Candidatus Nezhaarchaeales archaeon]